MTDRQPPSQIDTSFQAHNSLESSLPTDSEIPYIEPTLGDILERAAKARRGNQDNSRFEYYERYHHDMQAALSRAVGAGELSPEERARVEASIYAAQELSRTEDELTGLMRRGAFEERVAETFSMAARHDHTVAVAIADLDRFKLFNDKYGHLTGDHVLNAWGQYLQERLRLSDVVCRWGGEELIFMLPETNEEGAFTLLNELREKMSGIIKEILADMGIHIDPEDKITMSVGLLQVPPEQLDRLKEPMTNQERTTLSGEIMLETIAEADKLLNEAKQTGRNKVMRKEKRNQESSIPS